VQKERN
ncbi:hypothetical protein A2U01_0099025, partial [Trifolium medium]|nr:hypothetical protein [Trifolium medium]